MHTSLHGLRAGGLDTPEWLDMRAQKAGGQQRSLPTGAIASMAGHASQRRQTGPQIPSSKLLLH